MKQSYGRFALMIALSSVFMFAFMYLNSFSIEHVRWSTTRFYMTLMMTATMAIVMLTFMLAMYTNAKVNLGIYLGSFLLFAGSLYLVRSQTFIGDRQWMSAMIPHHSIAILTSERAALKDWRVRKLAQSIANTQRREIKEMEWLLQDIDRGGPAETSEQAVTRPVPSF